MLSVRMICVGKLGEKFWKQACDEYIKRLSGYCKPEVIELPEQKLPEQAARHPADSECTGERSQAHPRKDPPGCGSHRHVR